MVELIGTLVLLVGVVLMQVVVHRDAVKRGVHTSRGARLGMACGILGTSLGVFFGVAGALMGALS